MGIIKKQLQTMEEEQIPTSGSSQQTPCFCAKARNLNNQLRQTVAKQKPKEAVKKLVRKGRTTIRIKTGGSDDSVLSLITTESRKSAASRKSEESKKSIDSKKSVGSKITVESKKSVEALRSNIESIRSLVASRKNSVSANVGGSTTIKSIIEIHPLEQLAKQENWKEFAILLEEEKDHGAVGHVFSHSDSMLHMVCRYHPSLKIVKRVLEDRAALLALQEVNKYGQTPLHVAAACGASIKIVQYLVDMCPSMAAKQDTQGNTPLHLHFAHTSGEKVCDAGYYVPLLSSASQHGERDDLPRKPTVINTKSMIPNNSVRSTASTAASSIASLLKSTNSQMLSMSCHGLGDSRARKVIREEREEFLLGPRMDTEKNVASSCSTATTPKSVKALVMGPSQEVVLQLAMAWPASLLVENDEELNVVEMAILFESSFRIVTKLQEISRNHQKRELELSNLLTPTSLTLMKDRVKAVQPSAA